MIDFSEHRILLIALCALTAHLVALLVRSASRRILLRTRTGRESKALTITSFVSSSIVFGIYFAAFSFVLFEFGISLTSYLASASVLGLAVSFGSQGVVQDVITGLTLVFSDLIDVGDMVDIGGQVGIVESVSMRFTVLVNFSGARVFVPNRSITNVINYQNGYIRAYVDVRLPTDVTLQKRAKEELRLLARSVYHQYPGILLLPPSVGDPVEAQARYSYQRIKFRIWPGQGPLLEGPVKSAVAQSMRVLDPAYQDWMVSVHYRSESNGDDPIKRLPRPSALSKRDRDLEASG